MLLPETPCAFQFRNLGTSVEIEATVGEDRMTIDLNLAPTITFLNAWETFGLPPINVEQPRFQTLKMYEQLLLRTGIPALAGTFDAILPFGQNLPPLRRRKLLLFVTAVL
jgi:hypothetical protein